MRLVRVDVEEGLEFSSIALVVDLDLHDKKEGNAVALVLYNPGGNLVFMLKDGYDPLEVMCAGEKYLFETLRTNRFRLYKCQLISKERG